MWGSHTVGHLSGSHYQADNDTFSAGYPVLGLSVYHGLDPPNLSITVQNSGQQLAKNDVNNGKFSHIMCTRNSEVKATKALHLDKLPGQVMGLSV